MATLGGLVVNVDLTAQGAISNVTASTSARVGDYHNIAGNIIINNKASGASNFAADNLKITAGIKKPGASTISYLFALKYDSGGDLVLDSSHNAQISTTKTFSIDHGAVQAGTSSTMIPFKTGNQNTGFATSPGKHPLGTSTGDTLSLTTFNQSSIYLFVQGSTGNPFALNLGLGNSDLGKAFMSAPMMFSQGDLAMNIAWDQTLFDE